MVDLSSLHNVVNDQAIRTNIVNLATTGEYSHADYKKDGRTLDIGHDRVSQLLPLDDLVRASRYAYPQETDEMKLADYASRFAINYIQVMFNAGTGLAIDVILIAILGDDLSELTQRSPVEAGWYSQAYRVGVARGLLNASSSMVNKAGQGDLASQRLFLEKTGFLANTSGPARYAAAGSSGDYTPPVVPSEVADSLREMLREEL